MEKEATKFFEMLLNNSADILRELKMQVYKLLDLDGKIILPNKIDNERQALKLLILICKKNNF